LTFNIFYKLFYDRKALSFWLLSIDMIHSSLITDKMTDILILIINYYHENEILVNSLIRLFHWQSWLSWDNLLCLTDYANFALNCRESFFINFCFNNCILKMCNYIRACISKLQMLDFCRDCFRCSRHSESDSKFWLCFYYKNSILSYILHEIVILNWIHNISWY